MHWEPPSNPNELCVDRFEDRLELRGASDRPGLGVSVDLGAVRRTGMRNLPIARALGSCKTVVDATAGLCADAYMLALLGCSVTAIERSPMLAALAFDGLSRAATDPRVDAPALARLRMLEGDARDLLRTLPAPDAVFMDPMFPERKKASALPRKEIRLVRAAVGDDPDAAELFAVAMQVALRRVLVKRSDDSPALAGAPAPDLTF
ncbi:MAG: class I SAM-dependent methyltransferase, partial [Phycisphaerae bacterium]|nr:class I SAM-dependent methyltransferase [Phycisphaerae bacterium]